MSQCAVCRQELEEGNSFCHVCGAPAGSATLGLGGGRPTSWLVEAVDLAKGFASRSTDLSSSAGRALDLWLGSPISLQRQILYSLLGGLAIASWVPMGVGVGLWIQGWLFVSALFFLPVRTSLTGVLPLLGLANAIVGPEYSLRRRLLLSLLLLILASAPVAMVSSAWSAYAPPRFGAGFLTQQQRAPPERTGHQQQQPQQRRQDQDEEAPSPPAEAAPGGGISPLPFVGSFLVAFYLMGFSANWRAVGDCEFSLSRERMAVKAGAVAKQIREAMVERRIPGLELTRVEMAKLRRYTAGAASGTEGEQLSFICGTARILVFVQDFGTGLFIRWAGFLDFSGRRLWLLIGFVVARVDSAIERWLGSSLLDWSRQVSETLSPGTRNQLLLRSTSAGLVARILRLAQGISEYSWNELHALEAAVQESVVAAVRQAQASHEEADRIRAQIERHSGAERRSGWAGGRMPR